MFPFLSCVQLQDTEMAPAETVAAFIAHVKCPRSTTGVEPWSNHHRLFPRHRNNL